jgi:hypothetical protein
MNEREEPVGRLELVGYEKITDHGLALPVFGRSQGANVYYTARSSSIRHAPRRLAKPMGGSPASIATTQIA